MFLETVVRLNAYLESQVVSANQQGQRFHVAQYLEVLPPHALAVGDGIHDVGGVLYGRRPGGDASQGYECLDLGGVMDPVEGTVPGDHYANSHLILSSALLFQLTGDRHYLSLVQELEPFALRQLLGYPRVPWGMHHDFNNYAMGMVYELLEQVLDGDSKARWREALARAPVNLHRVTNWWGQRLLYGQSLLHCGGAKSVLKGMGLVATALPFFLYGLSGDGCLEDKRNHSRPVQYHAFSLALAVVANRKLGNALRFVIAQGIDYLSEFIAVDGDFNYFGRGHKQIFAYSPALFALAAVRWHDAAAEARMRAIWDYVKGYQEADGAFPLVLGPNGASSKVGWYDYHRHTVYNAFFNAWLALAEYEMETGRYALPRTGRVSPRMRERRRGTIHMHSTPVYQALWSKGFQHYSSECGVSPHRIYSRADGVLMSCPGGPRPGVKGFGNIQRFEHEYANFFAPVARDTSGKWHGPGCHAMDMQVHGDTVSYVHDLGAIALKRDVVFGATGFTVTDEIQAYDPAALAELRVFNFPLLNPGGRAQVSGHVVSIGGTRIRVTVDGDPVVLSCGEAYPWVDGDVMVIRYTLPSIGHRYVVISTFDFE